MSKVLSFNHCSNVIKTAIKGTSIDLCIDHMYWPSELSNHPVAKNCAGCFHVSIPRKNSVRIWNSPAVSSITKAPFVAADQKLPSLSWILRQFFELYRCFSGCFGWISSSHASEYTILWSFWKCNNFPVACHSTKLHLSFPFSINFYEYFDSIYTVLVHLQDFRRHE